MRNGFLVACTGCLALAGASVVGADVVRFRNGDVLQGEVVDSEQQCFRFRRFDTGGLVTLSWDQILPEDRDTLRRRLRLDVDADAEIPSVEGTRLSLTSGESVEGLLEATTATEYVMRTTAGKFGYKKNLVEKVETTRLEMLQVFSRDEALAYETKRRAKAGEPTTGAEGLYGLAEFCMKIRHYLKAKDFYLGTRAADPKFAEESLKNVLERLEGLIRDSDAIDGFADVEKAIANKKFAEADTKWTALKDKYPDSDVVKENLESMTARIAEKRMGYLESQARPRWNSQLRVIAAKRGRDRETVGTDGAKADFTLNDAKAWSRKTLSSEIAAAVAASLGITPDEAKDVFAKRKTFELQRASYGGGTFIVQKANIGAPAGGANPGKLVPGKAPAPAAPAPQKQMQTPDDWWKKASGSDRQNWMTAFYAENGGDMEVVRIEERACQECAGRGYKTFLNPGAGEGGTKYEICGRCHGVNHDRVVVFK